MRINTVAGHLLEDADIYLSKIDPSVYSMPLELLFGATIGQHTRHFIEFFQCLLNQIESSNKCIDYSSRKRNLSLETDPNSAKQAIESINETLSGLTENIECRLMCHEHFEEMDTTSSVASNLERELLYNIEHTIHHLAIIKIGLAAIAPQIDIPVHFGVAPSTVQHKNGICAQ